ncbi:MAG: M48 family metallopeptidase [Saprospiraceae bacterium]|nr:M48 family metallopeptidase [Candidatus Vicinibacter affinis]MBP6173111.1 M48 family metallopeptidase [Saprospiraceae bacterium]MBP6522276.1 M48 family metallopeptidase [Saprospiraceae bacterium]
MLKLKPFKEIQKIKFLDFELPLEIHFEYRMSARVSLGKNKAIVRIPIIASSGQKDQHILWAKDWIYKKIAKDPEFSKKYQPRAYENGSKIQVRQTEFTIFISESDKRITGTGKRIGTNIFIELPKNIDASVKQKMMSDIMSRVMSATYLNGVKSRVQSINEKFFRKEINVVRLRNNNSNWGSCSTNKNISLSSRLLLCPDFIFDYIIIHELAHLQHHNHSKAFWNLVECVMPEFKLAEKWLKKHGEEYHW